jgi:hypothetical protein
MATLSATCATLLTVLRAAAPGDVVDLPLQPQPCGYVRIHNVVKAEPGVTIRIHPQQRIGPHITNSAGLNFVGGTFADAGSTAPKSPGQTGRAAVYVRFSERISFRNGTFGTQENLTGSAAIMHDNTDWEIVGSRFAFRRIDAIVVTNSHRFRIIDNDIPDTEVFHHRCRFPDGTLVNPWTTGKTNCESQGGTYFESTHPDGVQMYHNISDGLLARNRVSGGQQGLGFMGGSGTLGWHRVAFVDNTVTTNYYRNGIAVGSQAENILIRGNRVARQNPSPVPGAVHIVIPWGGTRVGCENIMEAGSSVTPWGRDVSGPCPAVLPDPPLPPRGLPPLVDTSNLPQRMR